MILFNIKLITLIAALVIITFISVSAQSSPEPNAIILSQNTPNPFADSTVISFYLPTESYASISVYNEHLEIVKEFPKALYSSGINEIILYSDQLTPGIYFYKLRVDDFVEVKKMVMVN